MENNHRWGDNGGLLRGQHDVYNAGMLIEAGVHYYQATGKTRLLEIATRFANYMADYMGPEPRKNIVPAHSGPEEAVMALYWLYKNEPELKDKLSIPVRESDYYNLATFWIENRGHHCGFPLWGTWGYRKSEKWIKDACYHQAEFGTHSRPSWGEYSQDSIPVLEQKTIEGHAVRATLMATGLTAAALENQSPQYIETAKRLWENMAGRRMFIHRWSRRYSRRRKVWSGLLSAHRCISGNLRSCRSRFFQPTHEPINLQCPLYGRSGKSALQQCTDWRFFVR